MARILSFRNQALRNANVVPLIIIVIVCMQAFNDKEENRRSVIHLRPFLTHCIGVLVKLSTKRVPLEKNILVTAL